MTLSLRALVAALAVIFVLAFVLPPSAATWMHRRRVARASNDVGAIADRLRTCGDERLRVETGTDRPAVTGPGNLPVTPSGPEWLSRVSTRYEICGWPLHPDPWGNRYLIGRVWVLSAGTNGILQTPFPGEGSVALAGDDVGRQWHKP